MTASRVGDVENRRGDLADVVVAFDIDNTLLDPDGAAYKSTVTKLLERIDLGCDVSERVCAYEDLRAQGDALERLGLCNPIHERGNVDALATLCLTRCRNSALLDELGIDKSTQPSRRAFVDEFATIYDSTKRGTFEDRLQALISARRFCATDPRLRSFITEARRIGRHPRIIKWSDE
jgi:hypothetical protein